MRKSIKLFLMYFKLNLSSALEYRVSFITSAISMAVSNATFIFFWAVAFDQIGGAIGGYGFRDVMFIWAASSAAFGLANILFGNITHINDIVMTGELDTYLLQPRNTLMNLALSKTEFTAWGDLLYGVVLIACTARGIGDIAAFALAAITGGAIMASMIVIFQSTVFFMGNSSFLAGMSVNLSANFCTYPEGIFPKAVRFLLYWLIPAQFIVHVPLKLARGANIAIWLPAQFLAAAVFVSLAFFVFNRGLKRYESGNLIITRM